MKPFVIMGLVAGILLSFLAIFGPAAEWSYLVTFGKVDSGSRHLALTLEAHFHALVALTLVCELLGSLCLILFLSIWRLQKELDALKDQLDRD